MLSGSGGEGTRPARGLAPSLKWKNGIRARGGYPPGVRLPPCCTTPNASGFIIAVVNANGRRENHYQVWFALKAIFSDTVVDFVLAIELLKYSAPGPLHTAAYFNPLSPLHAVDPHRDAA